MVQLRWGICTAGKMSSDYADALLTLPRHQLVAIAARDATRAKQFAEKFNIAKHYSSYEELASDPEVDAVYVASTMHAHYDLCKLFLEAGKHVLCEKALTCAAWQAKDLMKLAEAKRLFLMEGIWSRCFPLYAALRKLIDSGELGQIYGVESHLMIPVGQWLATQPELGGAMWDLGVYPLQFAHFVFDGEAPTRIHAVGRVLESGADQTVVVAMQYKNGRFANFSVSFGMSYSKPSVIYAEKALVTIPEVWSPVQMTITPKVGQPRTVQFEALPTLPLKTNYSSSGGLVYEAEHVYDCISQGLVQSPLVPHSLSLWMQEVIDECLKQVGRKHLPTKPQ